jgi:uncharacterized protein YjiS (DUF1127 family)
MATLTAPGNVAARENVRHAPKIEIGAILLALLDGIEDWIQRREQRLTLAEMTDDQLKDVGLTAADVAREIAKPFWRA